MIAPVFFWDFGPASPPDGPGPAADRHQLRAAGTVRRPAARRDGAAGRPGSGGLAYPPALADLTGTARVRPELRIDGYVGGALVASVLMSADPARDRLALSRTTPRCRPTAPTPPG